MAALWGRYICIANAQREERSHAHTLPPGFIMARSRSEFLRSHVPIHGILIRAGSSKSPRVIGRLWHAASGDQPSGSLLVSEEVFDRSDVEGWEREIESIVADSGEDGPCVRLELLDRTGRPSVTWQQSKPAGLGVEVGTDPQAQALAVMAQGYADLVAKTGDFVAVQTRAHQALGETFAATLDRLMSLCADVVEAHSQTAETTLQSAIMVVEGTADEAGSAVDQSAMWGMLQAIAGNLGIPIPEPPVTPDPPPSPGPTDV